MGIRSLTSLIKQKSPDSIQTAGLYKLAGKKVAIDTSIFLYKSLTNVRNNGEYLINKDNKIVSHIVGLFYKTIQYLSLGIIPIYIFDGKPPSEKINTLKERNKKASECKELAEKSDSKEEKIKYEKGSIRIQKSHIDDLKKLFNLMGVSYIHPNGEAEAYAAELCRKGIVDYVISEDMDTLVYGCPKLIRSCLDKSIKRRDVVSIIDLETILKDFKMDMSEFIDMCIICGCDYCPTIPKVGTVRSYNYIQTYKTIEKFIQSGKCSTIPEEFIQKFNGARNLFLSMKDINTIENIPIIQNQYNKEKLKVFLIEECSMSEKKIENSLKKIKPSP